MKATVIKQRCVGCGMCEKICPNGIEVRGETAVIKNENLPCIIDATNSCPQNAIIVEYSEKDKERIEWRQPIIQNPGIVQPNYIGRGIGMGQGRGIRGGRGMGRGRGIRGGRGIGRGRGIRGGRGIGRGRRMGTAWGPRQNEFCVCSNCGYVTPQQIGNPCYQVQCPQCGNAMTRR